MFKIKDLLQNFISRTLKLISLCLIHIILFMIYQFINLKININLSILISLSIVL